MNARAPCTHHVGTFWPYGPERCEQFAPVFGMQRTRSRSCLIVASRLACDTCAHKASHRNTPRNAYNAHALRVCRSGANNLDILQDNAHHRARTTRVIFGYFNYVTVVCAHASRGVTIIVCDVFLGWERVWELHTDSQICSLTIQ